MIYDDGRHSFSNSTKPNHSRDGIFFLKDVTRAATAAPTYFELANIRSGTQIPYALIDGGIIANNPTMCAYAEARKVFNKPRFRKKKASAEDFAILSIGTGYSKKKYDYFKVKEWGLIEWIKPMIDMMMDGVSDTLTTRWHKYMIRLMPGNNTCASILC